MNVEALVGIIGFIFVIQWLSFLLAYLYKSEHFYDLVGSGTYVVVIAALFLLGGSTDRDILIFSLVIVWALRLGSFLFARVRQTGKDRRFDKIKTNFKAFFLAWTLQGVWVAFTLSAVLASAISAEEVPLGLMSLIGLVVWCIGFMLEVISDYQKRRFRFSSANKNTFIQTGLWAKSRHPNYLGEIVLWVGIAIIAMPIFSGWLWAGMISPIFVYILISRVSGIPLLEAVADKKWGDDPNYCKYKAQTPVLFPRIFFR